MDLRQLTENFAVSPQVGVADMAALAEAGYRSVMCNRPNDEDPGQPDYDAIAEAAAQAGLEIRWVPVVSGGMTPDVIEAFRAAVDEMPGPMLAYCRSGTRCTTMWAITQHGQRDSSDIARRAANVGYDVSGILAQLDRS